jgi:hypothetical protein
MDIKKEAIKRVIDREGSSFLNDPVVIASGVANEMISDEEARIRAERKPKARIRHKKGKTTRQRSMRRR